MSFVAGDLPSAVGDVLEAVGERGALGIHRGDARGLLLGAGLGGGPPELPDKGGNAAWVASRPDSRRPASRVASEWRSRTSFSWRRKRRASSPL
jgi:hypothetical protein